MSNPYIHLRKVNIAIDQYIQTVKSGGEVNVNEMILNLTAQFPVSDMHIRNRVINHMKVDKRLQYLEDVLYYDETKEDEKE